MPVCPRCSTPSDPAAAFCAACGSSLRSSSLHEAQTVAPGPAAAAPPRGQGRVDHHPELLPGAMVAGRYRIVARVGRGGMGEVYRADDLTLGQTVALKFMAPEIAASPSRRDWFIREVRVARQITQPNVCRVHDIGFLESPHGPARPYLSMEFVDGEDLASLLRRIGRLPPDKAAQVAAQICAGLAAAHAQGVLHRDLKPANIMLDGRGHVRITDFGLAALAEDLNRAGRAVAGTPAYMSPEQLAGGELTARSDLFSLGLVLYELYTGQRAVRGDTLDDISAQLASRDFPMPGARAPGIPAEIEAVIMRCLEPLPADRPASAAAVAAALPGGDPLAGVLAAGQTPDPSVLAASGHSGRISVLSAAVWLAACVLGVLAVAQLNTRASLVGIIAGGKPPAVLLERASDLIRQFGYTPPAAGTGRIKWGWRFDEAMFDHIELDGDRPTRPGWWSFLKAPPAPAGPLEFWLRAAPIPIYPRDRTSSVAPNDLPPIPGEFQLGLDPTGRLLRFLAVPDSLGAPPSPASGSAPAPPWPALLAAAGLERDALTPAAVGDTAMIGDQHAAWTISITDGPLAGSSARIEAAALRSRPVLFQVTWPWGISHRPTQLDPTLETIVAVVFLAPLIVTPIIAGAVMARRNWRAGRGDRRGAIRVATAVCLLELGSWILSADHAGMLSEFDNFTGAFAIALASGAMVWMFYLALEPAVRRRRPAAILAWTRLTCGRARDPMVGRDILRGAAIGACWAAVYKLFVLIASHLPDAPAPTITPDQTLRGIIPAIGSVLEGMSGSAQYGLLMFMALLLLGSSGAASASAGAAQRPRMLWLRRAAFALFVLLLGVVIIALLGQTQASNSPLYLLPFGVVTAAGYFFVLARLGLVTAIVATSTIWTLLTIPASIDTSVWYGPIGLTAVIATLVAAGWGAWIAAASAASPATRPSLSPVTPPTTSARE